MIPSQRRPRAGQERQLVRQTAATNRSNTGAAVGGRPGSEQGNNQSSMATSKCRKKLPILRSFVILIVFPCNLCSHHLFQCWQLLYSLLQVSMLLWHRIMLQLMMRLAVIPVTTTAANSKKDNMLGGQTGGCSQLNRSSVLLTTRAGASVLLSSLLSHQLLNYFCLHLYGTMTCNSNRTWCSSVF